VPKTALEIFADKVAHMLAAEKSLDKAVRAFQQKLYELILSEYLPLFEVEDGVVLDSAKNDALLLQIDNLFAKLEKAMQRDVLAPFAKDLLKSAELSAQYYVALGFKKTVVNGLMSDKVRLERRLGITPSGRLRKNSYLYKLGQTAQVRQELLEYVVKNLTGDTSFKDFQLGFRNLVVGNRRTKAKAVNGNMVKYFDQFAYDAFGQFDAVANKQLARGLNLRHMVYEGDLIDTSRKFCRKYAGKAFVVKDWVKMAKNDPHLIDQKRKASYRPLIDRGRYRCRHWIRYITETIYEELK